MFSEQHKLYNPQFQTSCKMKRYQVSKGKQCCQITCVEKNWYEKETHTVLSITEQNNVLDYVGVKKLQILQSATHILNIPTE